MVEFGALVNYNKTKRRYFILSFAQKLKTLRKEHNYSQEDLAQILDVSRQAVSKWESDRGIPETDKLVQISSIFGVTLDYLLKNEQLADEQLCNSYYVSREMIDGFLSYKRHVAKRIVIGVSLIVLSNTFISGAFGENDLAVLFYWIMISIGIAVLVWNFLQPKRYKEISNKQLLFDEVVIKEFRKEHEKNRKLYVVMIILAVIIFIVSPQIITIFLGYANSSIGFVLLWILHASWLSLVILAGIALYSENILVNNNEHIQRKDKKGKQVY